VRDFYNTINQLPDESAVYFSHYHNHWFSNYPRATKDDLYKALAELRLAYKKYENSRFRIKEMADIVQIGINKLTKKEYQNPSPPTLKDQIIQSLF